MSLPNAAQDFNIQEALEALKSLMLCAKEKEEVELSNRYDNIHSAPLEALWQNLPEGITLPPGAIQQQTTQPLQVFREVGRGAPRHPSRGRGRHPYQGRGVPPMKGIQQRGRRHSRQTVQAMMMLLNGMIEQC